MLFIDIFKITIPYMKIGIALVAAGLVIIALSMAEIFTIFVGTRFDLWWALSNSFSHQHYFLLFGIGFLLIGIKLSRKKRN